MSDLYRHLAEMDAWQLARDWAPELRGVTPDKLLEAMIRGNAAEPRDPRIGGHVVRKAAAIAFAVKMQISPPSWWSSPLDVGAAVLAASLARRSPVAQADASPRDGTAPPRGDAPPPASSEGESAVARRRRPGNPGETMERVKVAMREVPREELAAMKEEQMRSRFGAARSTCRMAREAVLAKIGEK